MTVQELINQGYGGYQGWSDAAAEADFRATGGQGKRTGGGSSSSGGGFDFNFEDEAKKAYGELGAYYDRILRESQGDVNLAITRLDEDYSRGERYKRENIAIQLDQQEQQRKQAINQTEGVSNARGLMGRSSFAGGFGLGDERKNTVIDAFNKNKTATETDLTRFLEGNKIERERKVTDMRTNLQRKEFDLEQNRRKESADLANIRGQRALSRFNSGLI
jgi:hypothetical protein